MPRKLLKEFTPERGYTKADWDEVSDNPELTDEQLAQMRTFAEVFPELAARSDADRASIQLRVDRDVLEAYRASGPGWRERMNAALRAAMPKPAAG